MRPSVRLLLALVLAFTLAPAAAHATPHSPVSAAVAMGDSYISGEAGRWAGNSIDNSPGNDGTDRACLPAGSPLCQVDTSKVYLGASDSDGCHRSDVSELLSASLPVDRRLNISCSGAVSSDLLRTSTGGTSDHGEAPQGDQLAPLARDDDVKLITVSIGGNDFGFADIVQTCFERYASMQGPCEPIEQPKIDAAKPGVIAKVSKTLGDIRAVMAGAGYKTSDYRLIVQTYPSVAPRAADGRYGADRTAHGCPFYDSDGTWARDHAVYEIGDAVKAAARAEPRGGPRPRQRLPGPRVLLEERPPGDRDRPPRRRALRVGPDDHPHPGPDPGALPPQRLRAEGAGHVPVRRGRRRAR